MMAYIVETIEQAKSHSEKLEDMIKLAKQVLDLSQSKHPCDVQTGQVQSLGLLPHILIVIPSRFLCLVACSPLLASSRFSVRY